MSFYNFSSTIFSSRGRERERTLTYYLLFIPVFDYKITFVNSQHTPTNSKDYFEVKKNSFKRWF